jgi:Glycosyl transferases group 1
VPSEQTSRRVLAHRHEQPPLGDGGGQGCATTGRSPDSLGISDRFHHDAPFGFRGALKKGESIQYPIEALAGLDRRFELHVIGDGPYLDTVREFSSRRSVPVVFHYALGNGGLERKGPHETARIFAFASTMENFPLVLLEAMTTRRSATRSDAAHGPASGIFTSGTSW